MKELTKKLLFLKLDSHTEYVKKHLKFFKGIRVNNDLVISISDNPDYILEKDEDMFYFYPKGFEKYKNKFTTWSCKFCSSSDILRDIKNDEKVEILNIDGTFQERLY